VLCRNVRMTTGRNPSRSDDSQQSCVLERDVEAELAALERRFQDEKQRIIAEYRADLLRHGRSVVAIAYAFDVLLACAGLLTSAFVLIRKPDASYVAIIAPALVLGGVLAPLAIAASGFAKLADPDKDPQPPFVLGLALLSPPLVAVGVGLSIWGLVGSLALTGRSDLDSSPARAFVFAVVLGLAIALWWLRQIRRSEIFPDMSPARGGG
jgi:hypothetical protein